MIRTENDWRHTACPGYGSLYCPAMSDDRCKECWGEYHCNNIYDKVEDFMFHFDNNDDEYITNGGWLPGEKYDLYVAECDTDKSGNISRCELFECLVRVENYWRLNVCQNSVSELICDLPNEEKYRCPDCD
jgi:hypothetical protein